MHSFVCKQIKGQRISMQYFKCDVVAREFSQLTFLSPKSQWTLLHRHQTPWGDNADSMESRRGDT